MPKSKKARVHGPPAPGPGGGAAQKKARKMHTFSKLSTNKSDAAPGTTTKPKNAPPQRRPIVPFAKRDRILLVGEGESRAAQLAT